MICRKCGKKKEVNLFCKNGRNEKLNKGLCRKCKNSMDKVYRIKNKEKLQEYFSKKWRTDPDMKKRNRMYKDLQRYGFDASSHCDDKQCTLCGMTNNESLKKWGQRLQIHHKDLNGRGVKIPNNSKDNFMILCKSCHPKIDNPLKAARRKRLKLKEKGK